MINFCGFLIPISYFIDEKLMYALMSLWAQRHADRERNQYDGD